MKRILLLLAGIVFISASLTAQEVTNEERLNQINSEINEAVEAGNYDKAAALKEEREIRKDIKKAVEEGDYDKAAELKARLAGGQQNNNSGQNNTGTGNTNSSGSASPSSGSGAPGIRVENDASGKRGDVPASPGKEEYKDNKVTGSGFYLEFFAGIGFYQGYEYYSTYNDFTDEYDYYTANVSYVGPDVGFKVGNRFYFGGKGNPMRFGLDINYLDLNFNVPYDFRMSFVNPGFTFVRAFNDEIGIQANFNIGPALLLPLDSDLDFGLRYGPSVKFRYKILAAGLEYRGGHGFIEGYSASNFGVVFGMNF